MFSHLTREDRLSIFQKFSPVSFSRVIRTCKWANQFVETNKRKITIHTDKCLTFQLPRDPLGFPLATCVERVIKVKSADRDTVLEEIPCKSREYEAILAEPRFRCFVFGVIKNAEYAESPFDIPADYEYTLEVVTKVPARSLLVWLPSESIPTSSYNYDKIDIWNFSPSALDSAFDLAESNRNVTLHFMGNLNPHLVNRYCKLLEKIVEQKIVTERIYISGGFSGEENTAEMLKRFLEAKTSETMVLAEGFEISLIAVTQKSLLAVYWRFNKWAFNEAKLIGSRETLYEHIIELSRWWTGTGERLTAEEVRSLPVVQEICNRFFS